MLIKHGIPAETLENWSERIDKGAHKKSVLNKADGHCRTELISEKFRMCLHWRFTWGRRYASDGVIAASADVTETSVPAPARNVPQESEPSEPLPDGSEGFRLFTVSHTKEDAAALARLRKQKANDLPVPMVVKIRHAQEPVAGSM